MTRNDLRVPLRRKNAAAIAVAILFVVAASVAYGQVYKCTDDAGRTVYADTPCGAGSAPLRLPDEPTKSSASPTACAQLKDEIQRLGAQADRNAERGRKESAASTTRRQSLSKQYAARCAGIARSATAPK
jgi:Domain of unknown function (DUF4124)